MTVQSIFDSIDIRNKTTAEVEKLFSTKLPTLIQANPSISPTEIRKRAAEIVRTKKQLEQSAIVKTQKLLAAKDKFPFGRSK